MIVPQLTSKAEQRAAQDRRAAGLALAGLALSAVFGLLSPDGIVQFDDLTHYLFARYAWTWPQFLLDTWGRPGFTTLYFLPAGLGWPACRLLSAILTAWSAWLAYRIALGMKIRQPWIVIILAFGQPLFFQLSLTTLTETALAFYLTASVYLAQRGRWSASAALLSLGFVTRHEAIVFLPALCVFAWRARVNLLRLWPLLWAPLLVNLIAPLADMEPPLKLLIAPRPSAQYGKGGWLTFFSRSLEAWGPAISALAIAGWWTMLRTRRGALAATCIALYFGAQTAVRALGLYDSGGYARFLVSISPLVAISAAVGWQRLWSQDERIRRFATLSVAAAIILLWVAMESQILRASQHRDLESELPEVSVAKLAVRIATAALLTLAIVSSLGRRQSIKRFTHTLVPGALVVLATITTYRLCGPLPPPPEAEVIRESLDWLDRNGYADREIISGVVWIEYVIGKTRSPFRRYLLDRLEKAPIGTIFAYDRQFAGEAHGLSAQKLRDGGSFNEVYASPSIRMHGPEPYLTLFEKVAEWAPSKE
ncbi:MAG: hypothetical protein O7D94_10710 [Planctomycetota bacterium]|nr:hypothetical protein [Planctomycetota bacterium]